jgi:anthranilate/para-aminobenzoate synthase component II
VPQTFEAGRYHSLVIPSNAVPEGFAVTARVDTDGTIMAIGHERLPVFGVQFHPESVLTTVGHRLLQNFLESR